MRKILLFVLCAASFVINGFGQQERGTITGAITTTDDKPAGMVTVKVKETKKNTLTADDDTFIFRNMQPGSYQLFILI